MGKIPQKIKPTSPKQCECGRQGYIKDSRKMANHVQRRYSCECGLMWSTKEVRDFDPSGEVRKLKESMADKLIEMAQELLHG